MARQRACGIQTALDRISDRRLSPLLFRSIVTAFFLLGRYPTGIYGSPKRGLMRSGPIALLALAFSVFTTVARADTLLTWEFSGTFTPTGPYGSQPFKLQVSFDPTAPDIRNINQHLGLYLAITSANLQIGDDSMTTS